MWPRPRPESWGTAAPQAATSGHSTSETLSPTPPVECLSTVGRPSPDRSSRSPLPIMAAVQVDSSRSDMPRHTMAMSRAAACSAGMEPEVIPSMNQLI